MPRRRRKIDRAETPEPITIETTPQDGVAMPLPPDAAPDATGEPQDAPVASPPADLPDHIPPHVWATIQRAGARGAERLAELLDSPGWARLKVTDQLRAIELAMTRAYGPPIKREVSVALTGKVSDATSDALAAMSGHDLPEYTTRSRSGAGDRAKQVN